MKFKINSLILTCIMLVVLLFGISTIYKLNRKEAKTAREKYEDFIYNHAYSNRDMKSSEVQEDESESDRPDLAFEQDFLKTVDPKLGYPPRERLYSVYEKVKQFKRLKSGIPGDPLNNWIERGPNNIAGRVRALIFDPNDINNKKVWAGSVSGGLWYNNDITDANSAWHAVDDFWANIAISSIGYDPNNKQIFYVATGEGWYNSNGVMGAGIWKSVNGGQAWDQLSSTTNSNFQTTQKIQVTSTGRVIAGTNKGIYISDDGGLNWTSKSTGFVSDIEVAGNGIIYAGKGRVTVSGAVLKSIDNGDSWLDITPPLSDQERVELAVAPSNNSIIYALASKGDNVSWFKKSIDGGANWTSIAIPKYVEQTCVESSTYDFTRGQAWFDLSLAVHPTDPGIVIAGGIDIARSIDGGIFWKPISYWTGTCYSYVHADIHSIIFRPGKDNEIIVGTDGGVSYSADAALASSPVFNNRNNGLNVTQYYSCAIHPDPMKDYFLGGAQDNGSHKFEFNGVNSVTSVSGGDGAFCFIDQKNPEIQISSYVYNNYYVSKNAGITFSTLLALDDGSFINPADYDNNLHILYSAKGTSTINRITNINEQGKVGSFTISGLGSRASHIKVSKYTTNSSTLFVGTQAGRLFKVTNAEGSSSVSSEITGSSFPTGNISCIDIGADEKELVVTFSNYGVISVWYSSDGGTSWSSKEGNLPDMPVRWALFNPNNRKQVLLATEVGIWSTNNFNDTSPVWNPSISGLANVRVDMFRLRESDFEVIAATHGRGIFTSDAFSNINKNELSAFFSTKGSSNLNFGGTVQFEDLSTGKPTSYSWTFEGGSPSTSSSPNPSIIFSESGSYDVSLAVSDGVTTKTLTKTDYIKVGGSNQWKEQSSGFTASSRGIDYIDLVDKMVVWAIAFDGSGSDAKIKEFTKTIDGGNHWTPGVINVPGEIYPAMICALNKDTAWVPMYSDAAIAGEGIYCTKDGGTTWTKQATASFSGADAFANVVHFWNKNDGFCMGDPNDGYFEIYTTKNGGENWTRVPKANIPARSASDEYGTVGQFCISEDGVAFFNTTKGRIFKSKDKGVTWSIITTPLKARTKIAFATEFNGIMIENPDNINTFKVYYTKNGGVTWIQTANTNVFPYYVEYVPGSGRMYVSSSMNSAKAGASYSIDGGITWTKFSDLESLQCLALDFYDMSTGWIGQYNTSSTQGGVLKYYSLLTIPDFLISPENPVIEAPVIFTDNSMGMESSKSYLWNFGENATPSTTTGSGPHTVNYSAKGNKTVTMTVNGNAVTKVFNISITDIEKISQNSNFEIYPNPSSGMFNLKFEIKRASDLNVNIYNLKGQIVYSNRIKLTTSNVNFPIDLSKSGKGIYLLKISGENIHETRKIILK